MTRILLSALFVLLSLPLSAQVRIDVGLAAGRQSYEAPGLGSRFVLSPEVLVSRNRLSAYYALDHADLSFAGSMYASHFGAAYSWRVTPNVAFRAGAGPSYVSIENLGGELAWNAQAELALRRRRFELFTKVRFFEYSLAEFRTGSASPDGPALLAGVRFGVAGY
jgi:hypothetical protein